MRDWFVALPRAHNNDDPQLSAFRTSAVKTAILAVIDPPRAGADFFVLEPTFNQSLVRASDLWWQSGLTVTSLGQVHSFCVPKLIQQVLPRILLITTGAASAGQ